MVAIIVFAFIFILVTGFVTIRRRLNRLHTKFTFAQEYREKFIQLANSYFQTYERYFRQGTVDNELYIWLTKNVNQIQSDLGHIGTMHYMAPFQTYQISNYQIIINTLPKFRAGSIEEFDVTSSDDCLIRYLGGLEKTLTVIEKHAKNPIIWFKEGFQQVISLPLYLFNWFGIVSDRSFVRIMGSVFYKVISGIAGLVAFLSGLVTIIQGKEETVLLFKKIFDW